MSRYDIVLRNKSLDLKTGTEPYSIKSVERCDERRGKLWVVEISLVKKFE